MTCQYHARNNAIWRCTKCNQDLCDVCIPGGEANFKRGQPRCPVCTTSLDHLGDGKTKEPFWRMPSQFFRYAASPTLLIAAALAGIFSGMFFLFYLIFQIVLVRYGLMVITRLSEGNWQHPSLSDAIRGDISLFYKQLFILFMMIVVPLLLVQVSPMLGYSLAFLGFLAVPASTMILALTQSVGSALNPAAWIRLMWTIGWPYIVLWLAWGAVTSAPDLIASLNVEHQVAAGIISFAAGFSTFYCGVVGFAMMGYLLYEHAEKLNIQSTLPRGKDLPPAEYSRREALGVSHIYAQLGRIDEARKAVSRALNESPADIALNERQFLLLKLTPKKESFLRFSEDYLRLLTANDKTDMAITAYLDIRQHHPQYTPTAPDIRTLLARGLSARQKWREAKPLLVNLHSQHPNFAELGSAYVLLARVYLESTGGAENAGKILNFLGKKFPQVLQEEDGAEVLQLYRSLSVG
jgi:tetratricopeptide (TPR) repeat protein